MAETVNIATMANKVSKELFEVFGWKRCGPTDTNWACCLDHRAKSREDEAANDAGEPTPGRRSKTHPSDVVFRYDDPYTDAAAYITTDLKSYGEATLSKDKVARALRSLCASVECANVSEEWAAKYVATHEPRWHAHGLLFLYNHDGKAAPEKFYPLVEHATPSNVRVPVDRRVFVFGPAEIAHLHAVARDLNVTFGGPTARTAQFRWFTPDLIIRKSRSPSFGEAAPAEVLLGPWQIVGIVPQGQLQPQSLRLYYRCRGETTVEELEYLIEFLFRHRLLDYDIALCFVGAQGGVLSTYQSAVNNVVANLYSLDEFRRRLEKVRPEVLSDFQTRFHPDDIGMERPGQ